MHTKAMTARVKAAGPSDGLGEGEFKALVSVFGNIDTYGDVVLKGAFTEDLRRWAESGDAIPVVWSHRWDDPFSHIGQVLAAEETDEGLLVHGALDLDNPTAMQVHRLLKGRRITQFSFAYDVVEGGEVKRDGETVHELRKLKVHEVGPCLVGVNQETDLVAAKALGLAKAGRVLSKTNLTLLTSARDALNDVIAAADRDAGDVDEEQDEKAAEPAAPETSAPSGADQTSEPSQDEAAGEKGEAPMGKSEIDRASAARRALAVALINETI